MNKIITAEEFMLENLQSMDMSEVENAMIEFAKMHVENALQEATQVYRTSPAHVNAILNAYPLDNIK